MSNPDNRSFSLFQTASAILINDDVEDLVCPFCIINFEKWSLLKQHLVRHVIDARAGKEITPVGCLSTPVPCPPSLPVDRGLVTATGSASCTSFHQSSNTDITNDETCLGSETYKQSNESSFVDLPNGVTGNGIYSNCKGSSNEKETNAKEAFLRNSDFTCETQTISGVNVSTLNCLGITSVIIKPVSTSLSMNPKTQHCLIDSSTHIYDGRTISQTIPINTLTWNQKTPTNMYMTSSGIVSPHPSIITTPNTPNTLAPVTTSSSSPSITVALTDRSPANIPRLSMKTMPDTFSNKEVLPSSLSTHMSTIVAVPSVHQVVANPLSTSTEQCVDCAEEESTDDPDFPLQDPSTNHSLPCGVKRPLQCVVRPFTTLSETDQTASIVSETHSSTDHLVSGSIPTPPVLSTKCQSSCEAAPVACTFTTSQCTGTSSTSLKTFTEHLSGVSAATCLPPGALIADDVGITDSAAAGDTDTVTAEPVKERKTNRKSHHCRTCRQFFPSRECLQQHQTESHNKGHPFECGECGRHFLSSHNLSTHRRHRHPSTAASPATTRRCAECGKCFSSKANLALHAKLHSGERPFLCTVCGARFSRKCTLESHLVYHSGDRRFTCDRCGARFYTSHSLARHAKLHTGDRSFVCEVCGASYVTGSDLKRHQLSHGSVKPFPCTSCTKTFARKHDLKVHERYHSGEFRHECPHCSKRFVELSNYRRHLRQHTGEKPYRCQACPLHFAQLHHLKKHLLSCSGPAEGGVSTATTMPLTAGPRSTRVGHLQKMNGS